MGGKLDLVGSVINRKAKYLGGDGAMDMQTLNKPTSVPLPAPLPVLLGCEFFGFFERSMYEITRNGSSRGVSDWYVMTHKAYGDGFPPYKRRQ